MKSTLIRASGSFGLVLFLFGVIAWMLALDGFFLYAAYGQLVLGLTLMCLYVAHHFKDGVRTLSSNRENLYGVLGGFFFLFCLIGLNVIAHSHWGERRFDMTVNKIHSLSPESKDILARLSEPVEVKAFLTHPQYRSHFKNVIDRYLYESRQISYEELDPHLEPRLLDYFEASENQVVLYNPARESSAVLSPEQFTEQGVTMALNRVASGDTPTVYFLQGNGEAELEGQDAQGLFLARHRLEREGYRVRSLNLREHLEVPEDANAVVYWGGRRPAPQIYTQVLRSYLESGGRLIVGLNPIYNSQRDGLLPSGLEEVLATYGLSYRPGFIAQEVPNRQGQTNVIWQAFAMSFPMHPITESFAEEEGGLLQFSLSFPIDFSAQEERSLREVALASTNDQARLGRDIGALFRGETRLADDRGPFAVAHLVEEDVEDGVTRLIVFGNSSFLQSGEFDRSNSRDIFLNSLDYLTDREHGFFVRQRSFQSSTLDMSEPQKMGAYFASLFLFPQLIILFGLGVWTFRRSRV